MTDDEYFKSLSVTDWDKAEAIEAELRALLSEGMSEDVGVKFVRTVMEVRKTVPRATVSGVFDEALNAGLTYITYITGPKRKQQRKGKLSGNGA